MISIHLCRIMLSEATTTSENDPQDEELKRIIESSLSAAAAAVPGVEGMVHLGGGSAVGGNNSHLHHSDQSAAAPAAAGDLFSCRGPVVDGFADASTVGALEAIPLDPPLGDDYVLNLGDHEGLDDLFLHDIMGNG